MQIAIVGAGAMGSLLGFYLSGVRGHTIWLLDGWAEHVAALQRDGLACEHDGEVELRPVAATSDPAQIGVCDVVLVLVKAPQTAVAAEQARALTGAATRVITLQNGVGNQAILAATLGAERVGQGITMLGATLLGPGHIRHAGMGPTYFAAPDATGSSPEHELATIFQSAGLPAELRSDVETLIWSKLAVNAAINPLGALLRVTNGALAAHAPTRDLMQKLVAETAEVAAARGTPLPDDVFDQVLAVAHATGANRCSMLQDVVRGSPTEIETINAAVVREGTRLGIATPYNQMVSELVRALDAVNAT